MFKSVHIQNFRQFQDLELKDLARINLITGMNSAGKTSLLEAVYLLDSPFDPSRTLTIAQFRGIGISAGNPELWDWLFRDRNTSQPIELRGRSQDGEKSSLVASLSRGNLIPTTANGTRGGLSMQSISDSSGPPPALHYESQMDDGPSQKVQLAWTNDGLRLDPDLQERRAQGFFLPEFLRAGPSEAVRLSRLEVIGRDGMLVEALQAIEPRLRQLRVLDLGEGARIYADIGQHSLVPLAVMGQGIGRLLMIVAAILLRESSVYLIDELSDGFHYSTLVNVWRVIVNVAAEQSAQIFATTHSLEAIQAAVQGSKGHEDELALFRLSRRDGDVHVTAVEDEGIRAAVEFAFELR